METARPIHLIIKEYLGKKRLGRFWPKMLGRLRKCSNDNLETHLESLDGLEVFQNYELASRIVLKKYDFKCQQDHFKVTLRLTTHASFKKEDNNCYCFELIAILWDKDGEITQHTSVSTPWIYKHNAVPQISMNYERTKWEKYYLLILRLQGGIDGKVGTNMPDQAVAIIGGGMLED